MLPILSSGQVRQVEKISMEREPITSIDLMERAASACAERILAWTKHVPERPLSSAVVLAGMGNNGGDGLVIARILKEAGMMVRVLRIMHRSEAGPEHLTAYGRALNAGLEVIDIKSSGELPQSIDDQLIIDCIFGSGLAHAPRGWLADLIRAINASTCPVVAIDLPSGAVAPESGEAFDPEACVRADLTLIFEVPRMALLMPETGVFAGKWELVPIDLDRQALKGSDRLGKLVELEDIRSRFRKPPRFGHKGTFGHARILAGSAGLFGAAVLAVQGALRSGVGLVSAHVPGDLALPLSVSHPDSMTWADVDPAMISVLPAAGKETAIGIGPGIGTRKVTAEVVDELLATFQGPLVLDADALNILAADIGKLDGRTWPVVLTPHPKEMDRLLGHTPPTAYARLLLTQAFARNWQCTVVLKGAYTAICSPDGAIHFNPTGNAGMAKGGSGDVLTGLLTGLLAQGYPPLDACLVGVYLHGLAGDLAAERLSMQAMRPSDLVDALPDAWLSLG